MPHTILCLCSSIVFVNSFYGCPCIVCVCACMVCVFLYDTPRPAQLTFAQTLILRSNSTCVRTHTCVRAQAPPLSFSLLPSFLPSCLPASLPACLPPSPHSRPFFSSETHCKGDDFECVGCDAQGSCAPCTKSLLCDAFSE